MSFPGFALGAELAQRHKDQTAQTADEQRQAELANIGTAGLTPEQQAEAIRTLYAKDPSAFKNHVENLFRRLTGKHPQPTPMAYPQAEQAGDQTLPAARTQAERRAQILSGGTTPEQRRQAEIQVRSDAQAANKTQPAPRPENLDQMIATAAADAVANGKNPNDDPKVQQLVALKASEQ